MAMINTAHTFREVLKDLRAYFFFDTYDRLCCIPVD